MPSSSQNSTSFPQPPSDPLAGEHWLEMTATLCPDATASFAETIDQDLADLEQKLVRFASRGAVIQGLRKSR